MSDVFNRLKQRLSKFREEAPKIQVDAVPPTLVVQIPKLSKTEYDHKWRDLESKMAHILENLKLQKQSKHQIRTELEILDRNRETLIDKQTSNDADLEFVRRDLYDAYSTSVMLRDSYLYLSTLGIVKKPTIVDVDAILARDITELTTADFAMESPNSLAILAHEVAELTSTDSTMENSISSGIQAVKADIIEISDSSEGEDDAISILLDKKNLICTPAKSERKGSSHSLSIQLRNAYYIENSEHSELHSKRSASEQPTNQPEPKRYVSESSESYNQLQSQVIAVSGRGSPQRSVIEVDPVYLPTHPLIKDGQWNSVCIKFNFHKDKVYFGS